MALNLTKATVLGGWILFFGGELVLRESFFKHGFMIKLDLVCMSGDSCGSFLLSLGKPLFKVMLSCLALSYHRIFVRKSHFR